MDGEGDPGAQRRRQGNGIEKLHARLGVQIVVPRQHAA